MKAYSVSTRPSSEQLLS